MKEHERLLRNHILHLQGEIRALRLENSQLRAKEEIYNTFPMQID